MSSSTEINATPSIKPEIGADEQSPSLAVPPHPPSTVKAEHTHLDGQHKQQQQQQTTTTTTTDIPAVEQIKAQLTYLADIVGLNNLTTTTHTAAEAKQTQTQTQTLAAQAQAKEEESRQQSTPIVVVHDVKKETQALIIEHVAQNIPSPPSVISASLTTEDKQNHTLAKEKQKEDNHQPIRTVSSVPLSNVDAHGYPIFRSAAVYAGTSKAGGVEASEIPGEVRRSPNGEQCWLSFAPHAVIVGEGELGKIRRGTIKWFDGSKGIGYIEPDRTDGAVTEMEQELEARRKQGLVSTLPSGVPKVLGRMDNHIVKARKDAEQDVFIHQSNIIADGYRMLYMGDKVEFQTTLDDKGRHQARHVTGIGGAKLTATLPRPNLFIEGGSHIPAQTAAAQAAAAKKDPLGPPPSSGPPPPPSAAAAAAVSSSSAAASSFGHREHAHGHSHSHSHASHHAPHQTHSGYPRLSLPSSVFTGGPKGYVYDGSNSRPAGMPFEHGTVKLYDNKKGWGFIRLDSKRPGEADVFVHQSAIHGQGFRYLLPGQRVELCVVLEKELPKSVHGFIQSKQHARYPGQQPRIQPVAKFVTAANNGLLTIEDPTEPGRSIHTVKPSDFSVNAPGSKEFGSYDSAPLHPAAERYNQERERRGPPSGPPSGPASHYADRDRYAPPPPPPSSSSSSAHYARSHSPPRGPPPPPPPSHYDDYRDRDRDRDRDRERYAPPPHWDSSRDRGREPERDYPPPPPSRNEWERERDRERYDPYARGPPPPPAGPASSYDPRDHRDPRDAHSHPHHAHPHAHPHPSHPSHPPHPHPHPHTHPSHDPRDHHAGWDRERESRKRPYDNAAYPYDESAAKRAAPANPPPPPPPSAYPYTHPSQPTNVPPPPNAAPYHQAPPSSYPPPPPQQQQPPAPHNSSPYYPPPPTSSNPPYGAYPPPPSSSSAPPPPPAAASAYPPYGAYPPPPSSGAPGGYYGEAPPPPQQAQPYPNYSHPPQQQPLPPSNQPPPPAQNTNSQQPLKEASELLALLYGLQQKK